MPLPIRLVGRPESCPTFPPTPIDVTASRGTESCRVYPSPPRRTRTAADPLPLDEGAYDSRPPGGVPPQEEAVFDADLPDQKQLAAL
jgi:hypothetical protein